MQQEAKALFVTAWYYPTENVTDACTRAVAEELIKQGVEVHVYAVYGGLGQLQKREVINGVIVHYPDKKYESKYENNKIAKLLFRLYFGQFDNTPYTNAKYLFYVTFKNLLSLQKKYGYDTIIPVNSVFHGLMGSYWVKKLFFGIKLIPYCLDGISNLGEGSYGFSGDFYKKHGLKIENRIFQKSSRIIMMSTHREHYKSAPFNTYFDKMSFAQPPLVQRRSISLSYHASPPCVVYTGYLSKSRYSVEKVLEIFEEYLKSYKAYFEFYGQGEAEEMIREHSAEIAGKGGIRYMGNKSWNEIKNVQDSADVLFSIGNELSEQISAKAFEYMSTGKKIIHFIKQDKDPMLPYYKKYPNTLIIDERDSINTNVSKLKRFFDKKTKTVKYSELSKVFATATPAHTAHIIRNILNKDFNGET